MQYINLAFLYNITELYVCRRNQYDNPIQNSKQIYSKFNKGDENYLYWEL